MPQFESVTDSPVLKGPRRRIPLEYRFANGAHQIRELSPGMFGSWMNFKKLCGIAFGIACVIFVLFAMVMWLATDFQPTLENFAYLLFVPLFALVGLWCINKERRELIESTRPWQDIQIRPSVVRIGGRGSHELLVEAKDSNGVLVTEDCVWVLLTDSVKDKNDSERGCRCDLLVVNGRKRSEMIWLAELIEKALIFGEQPVNSPPPTGART